MKDVVCTTIIIIIIMITDVCVPVWYGKDSKKVYKLLLELLLII